MKHYIFLLASIFSLNSLHSHIVSFSLWEKDGQQVCILGDNHAPDDPIGRREFKIIHTHVINRLAQGPEPVCFLLEASDFTLATVESTLKKKPSSSFGLLYILPLFAKRHKYQCNAMKFVFADMRGRGIEALTTFRQLLDPSHFGPIFLRSKVLQTTDELDATFKENPLARSKFFARGSVFDFASLGFALLNGPITVKDCIDEINALRGQLLDRYHQLKSDTSQQETCAILSEFVKELLVMKKRMSTFFTAYTTGKQDLVLNSIFNLIRKKESFASYLNCYEELIQPLTLLVTAAGYFLHFLDAQEQFSRIILFAGANHAIGFTESLERLGFRCVHHEGLIHKTSYGDFSGQLCFEFNEDRLKSLLSDVFSQASSPIVRACGACGVLSTPKNKLLQCSCCKNQWYCSRAHQKIDWKKHKHYCIEQ